MDRDTVIALAKQAAFHTLVQYDELIRFANLIEAHLKEQALADQKPVELTDEMVKQIKAAFADRWHRAIPAHGIGDSNE